MKIFVTGSASRLGKAISINLIENGFSVIGYDSNVSDLQHDLYTHVIGDIQNKSLLLKTLTDCDCVIHSAVYKRDYNKNLNVPLQVNVIGTINLYECVRHLNIAKIILISSAPVDKDFPNDNPFAWRSDTGNDHIYDLTKRLQEEIAHDYFETYMIPTTILRLGHVVDGTNNTDLEGTSLNELKYCLGGWVNYQDVSQAVLLALRYDTSRLEIFNIIGSEHQKDPFNIKLTIEKLGWKPLFRFKQD